MLKIQLDNYLIYGWQTAKEIALLDTDEWEYFLDCMEQNYPSIDYENYADIYKDIIDIYGEIDSSFIEDFMSSYRG